MKTRPESNGRKQSIVKRETGQRVNERAIEKDRKRKRNRWRHRKKLSFEVFESLTSVLTHV
jgi:hypothetical protein